MWLLYVKVFPRKFINYLKLSTFWIFMPENYLFMPIFNPLLTTDRHCGIQQVQIPLVSLHKRALKAILPKNTTITISDNNFLSILPLKERLFNYNNDVARPPCCIPLKSFPFWWRGWRRAPWPSLWTFASIAWQASWDFRGCVWSLCCFDTSALWDTAQIAPRNFCSSNTVYHCHCRHRHLHKSSSS